MWSTEVKVWTPLVYSVSRTALYSTFTKVQSYVNECLIKLESQTTIQNGYDINVKYVIFELVDISFYNPRNNGSSKNPLEFVLDTIKKFEENRLKTNGFSFHKINNI